MEAEIEIEIGSVINCMVELGGSAPAPEPASGDNSVHGSVERIIVNAGAFADGGIFGMVELIEEE